MTLDAGFPAALWAMAAATGIRPEWIVPVLYSESGLNPAQPNAAGYPYYGLNQIAGTYLEKRGITPADYLTWTASAQLSRVVSPYMGSQVAAFGPLRSGTRVYQSNFLPATLKTARVLSAVLATKRAPCTSGRTSDVYCANASLDHDHTGTITVADLAHFVSRAAAAAAVKSVLAAAYAAAPAGAGPMTDPVYGLDFPAGPSPTSAPGPGLPWGQIVLGLGIVGLGTWGVLEARRWRIARHLAGGRRRGSLTA